MPVPKEGPPTVPQQLVGPVVASLTLGLAPFTPEPHLVGKLRWLAGGAVGMAGADWLDLLMHGAPRAWLLLTLGRLAVPSRLRDPPSADAEDPRTPPGVG